VTTINRSRAILATGLLALWMGASDAMLKYLRPSMRPWLLAAAAGLIAIGAYGLIRAARLDLPGFDTDDHTDASRTGRSRVGWLLAVPVVVVILFGPQAMGDFAINRTPHLPPYAFDIASYASRTGTSVPVLKVSDVISGVAESGNSEYLSTHDVELRGFVSVLDVTGPDTFVMSHFLMSCCAADAQPMNLVIVGAASVPNKDQWIDLTARFDPAATRANKKPYGPVMRAKRIVLVSAPASPYETLR
jgi:uncharacterized repeat protein (TIGR03943 family)